MSHRQDSPAEPVRKLPFGLRVQLFLRSLSLQASWNQQRMQNLGLLATLLPWARSRRGDLNRDRTFCRRYYEYFNTNPYLVSFLVGGLVRLEDERFDGVGHPSAVLVTFRDTLGRALASLGDQLFWLGVRPALVMGICLLGLFELTGALIALVGLFALAQLILRWHGLAMGYQLGFGLVHLLQRRGWHRGIAVAQRTGMVLTGMTAGAYLALVSDASVAVDHNLLWLGVGVGLGLPVAARHRLPGELLILVGLGLALLLTFAVLVTGS